MTEVEIYEKRLSGELERFPYGFWSSEDNVRRIVKYLLEERLNYSDKQILENFSVKFIRKYKIWGAIPYFHGSPYELLNMVYPGKYHPWELNNVPMETWNQDTAIKAMQWLIDEKLGWNKDVVIAMYSKKTFKLNGMYGLLHYMDNSPYKALDKAYPGKYLPWELKNVPMNTWDDETCSQAVRWLFEKKLKWSEEEIRIYTTKRVFNENRLGGLLRRYNDNVFKLIDIGYPGKFLPQDLQHKHKK